MINYDKICYRVAGYTHNSYHKGQRLRGGDQMFESIGCHTCMYAGARRRRRPWRIVGSDNGIAYYRNRDGWFIPVGTIEEATA